MYLLYRLKTVLCTNKYKQAAQSHKISSKRLKIYAILKYGYIGLKQFCGLTSIDKLPKVTR